MYLEIFKGSLNILFRNVTLSVSFHTFKLNFILSDRYIYYSGHRFTKIVTRMKYDYGNIELSSMVISLYACFTMFIHNDLFVLNLR